MVFAKLAHSFWCLKYSIVMNLVMQKAKKYIDSIKTLKCHSAIFQNGWFSKILIYINAARWQPISIQQFAGSASGLEQPQMPSGLFSPVVMPSAANRPFARFCRKEAVRGGLARRIFAPRPGPAQLKSPLYRASLTMHRRHTRWGLAMLPDNLNFIWWV